MANPRWNRRETNVTLAGFYTVLRSTGFFSALSHLPGGYRYQVKGPATPDVLARRAATGEKAAEQSRAAAAPSLDVQMAMPWAHEHRAVRMALIAIVGVTITLGLIWWLWHAGG